MGDLQQEVLLAVYVDANGQYLGYRTLDQGRLSQIGGRYRELIAPALELHAKGILLAHNHPSGICAPSVQDVATTRALLALCRALEIDLVDHLIVAGTQVASMRRLLFKGAPAGASAGGQLGEVAA